MPYSKLNFFCGWVVYSFLVDNEIVFGCNFPEIMPILGKQRSNAIFAVLE